MTTTQMTTAARPKFELMPQAARNEFLALDEMATSIEQTLASAEINANEALKTLATARAINALRSALTPSIVQDLMALMNSPLGFLTDRDPKKPVQKGGVWETPKPYDESVVIDVAIQALMLGFRMTGNEVNVIAGNFYGTKHGFRRKILQYPGLSKFDHAVGIPTMSSRQVGEGAKAYTIESALVPARATWVLNGEPGEAVFEGEYRIAVRVNNGMGLDAINGKVESKLFRRVYHKLTGLDLMSDADADDDQPEPPADGKKIEGKK